MCHCKYIFIHILLILHFYIDYVEINDIYNSCWLFDFLLIPPWSWTYGGWIYYYLCNQCLSPLTLWVRIPLMERCTRNNTGWTRVLWRLEAGATCIEQCHILHLSSFVCRSFILWQPSLLLKQSGNKDYLPLWVN